MCICVVPANFTNLNCSMEIYIYIYVYIYMYIYMGRPDYIKFRRGQALSICIYKAAHSANIFYLILVWVVGGLLAFLRKSPSQQNLRHSKLL